VRRALDLIGRAALAVAVAAVVIVAFATTGPIGPF